MRLAIENYLAPLTERGELDVLVRNLLIAQGYEVIKRAFRGEKELGVDVAAIRKQSDGLHLYLFQVKAGDLTRSVWDDGTPNCVRSSLNEAIDAPFESFAKFKNNPPVMRHIIVVFNGDLREDCRSQFEGYVKQNTSQHQEITYWNISTLVQHVEASLLNEGLLPKLDAQKLKKALAFADVRDSSFVEYRELLEKISEQPYSTHEKFRGQFGAFRIVTRMIAEYARRGVA